MFYLFCRKIRAGGNLPRWATEGNLRTKAEIKNKRTKDTRAVIDLFVRRASRPLRINLARRARLLSFEPWSLALPSLLGRRSRQRHPIRLKLSCFEDKNKPTRRVLVHPSHLQVGNCRGSIRKDLAIRKRGITCSCTQETDPA